VSNDRIEALIENLGGSWRERRDAREALLALGPAAVPEVVQAVHHRNDQVRWEALKILSEAADPSLVPAFVDALRTDQNEGNRWVAVHALASLNGAALRPLLQALVQHGDSAFLRDGAHHVLRSLTNQGSISKTTFELIQPVMSAIEHIDPGVHVPLAAHRALDVLNGHPAI
jgi:HEAT repeat protein